MRSQVQPRRFLLVGKGLGSAGAIAACLLLGSASAPVAAQQLPTDPVTVLLPPVTPTVAPAPTATASRTATAAGAEAMVGTFELTAGSCSAAVSGSYFRMIQPGGTGSGPFVSNADSPCADKTYTPMAPGSDGGLTTGTYQPEPAKAFDSGGNGLAARVTKPQKFFGVAFASATNPTDPQTGTKVAPPTIRRDGSGHLSGDLRAFAATWNNQHFNQGAPKPDGSTPGATTAPTGTFDPSTGAYVLDWTSQIVGGSFNGFTGRWHFEGRFRPSPSSPQPTSTGDGGASSGNKGAAVGAVTTPGTTKQNGPSMAKTGPTFPTERGVWLLVGGLLSLRALSGQRRRHAAPGSDRP